MGGVEESRIKREDGGLSSVVIVMFYLTQRFGTVEENPVFAWLSFCVSAVFLFTYKAYTENILDYLLQLRKCSKEGYFHDVHELWVHYQSGAGEHYRQEYLRNYKVSLLYTAQ